MQKKTVNLIKKALRKISRFRPEVSELIKSCKVYKEDGHYKNGKPRIRLLGLRCQMCHAVVPKLEMDHVVEIGKIVYLPSGAIDWTTYIERLFCDPSNLQGLCEDCHKAKTRDYNKTGMAEGKFYV